MTTGRKPRRPRPAPSRSSLVEASEKDARRAFAKIGYAPLMNYSRVLLAGGSLQVAELDVAEDECVAVQGDLVVDGQLSAGGALIVAGNITAQDVAFIDAELFVAGGLVGRRVVWLDGESDSHWKLASLATPTLIAPSLSRYNATSSLYQTKVDVETWLRTDDAETRAAAKRLAGRRVFRGAGSHLYQAARKGVKLPPPKP
jgi:hypothetical protein